MVCSDQFHRAWIARRDGQPTRVDVADRDPGALGENVMRCRVADRACAG